MRIHRQEPGFTIDNATGDPRFRKAFSPFYSNLLRLERGGLRSSVARAKRVTFLFVETI